MSYLVLARKWRPQKFSDVIGQDHVTNTLKKAVEKERLAHAYLFSGPRGCGKTSTARLLAKVINCEDREKGESCNKCSSCVSVGEGNHLDMIEIDGASNRGIDEIRDLREKIGYASSQSSSKIYIIDEVHMLTQQAFNALLKTLEEPPSHVYLVFATTEPHKVPATILSRCQRFNFKRLEIPELTGQLEKICKAEKIGYDPEALLMISRRADGSMRDAESLLDQCISALDEKVDIDTVRGVLGLVDSQLITDLLRAVSVRDRKEALTIADRVVSSGLDIEEFFLAYLEGVRNLLVISIDNSGSGDRFDLTSGEIEQLTQIVEPFQTEDLLYLFRSGARSFRELKSSSHPRYHLEAAVTEAASWESAVDISELIKRLDGPGSPGGAPAKPPAKKAPVKKDPEAKAEGAFARMDKTAEAAVSHDDPALAMLGGREQWERFLAQVRESKLTLGIWLMSASVSGVDGTRIDLAFSPQNRFAREMISEEKNKRYIETSLERFYGRKFIVSTGESASNNPAPVEQQQSEETSGPAKKGIRDDKVKELVKDAPVVKRLLEEFDGELFKE